MTLKQNFMELMTFKILDLFTLNRHLKRGQRDCTTVKGLALNAGNLGLIPGTGYGPQALPGVNPEPEGSLEPCWVWPLNQINK